MGMKAMGIVNKTMIALCAISILVFNGASQAGQGALLDLDQVYPNIALANPSEANYDGTDLTITSTPSYLSFTSSETSRYVIIGGTFTLTATIDAGGLFTSGSYSISGSVVDLQTGTFLYTSGVLLFGDVTDYGIIDVGAEGGVDHSNFALSVTGGDLKPLFDAVSGLGASTTITLEDSTYDGTFMANDGTAISWAAANAKGDLGPVPEIPTLPAATIGFWKNHLDIWANATLNICGSSLGQDVALGFLSMPAKGDKTVTMGKQLIAAMLNEYVGNSCSTIPDAEAWLCSHGGIGSKVRQWYGGESLKNTLDDFNNGASCP